VLSTRRFTDQVARSWAAEITEDFIVDARKVDEVRAGWLNRSLIAGAFGALLVLAAVGANVFDRWMEGAPTGAAISPTISR
jgi:hypothetical protein